MMACVDVWINRWRTRWAADIAEPLKDTANLERVLAQFDAKNYVSGEDPPCLPASTGIGEQCIEDDVCQNGGTSIKRRRYEMAVVIHAGDLPS